MTNIILTFVFSIVMLMFMIYPAMKITEIVEQKVMLSEAGRNVVIVFLTVLLSLGVGLFLRFG
jgi:hypothetical protein